MSVFISAALALTALFTASPTPVQAQSLRYHFTAGETVRYLIQRDPYFDAPQDAIETVASDAEYRPPVVERLTETVEAAGADGTATLLLTLTPEPGFEDADHPQAALSRTVRVSASGHILSVSAPALGTSPAEQDLLRGLVLLPPGTQTRKDGLAVKTSFQAPTVSKSTSPDHDGTLLQTTQTTRSDRWVFNGRRGWLEREVSTLAVTLSLVMTGRGRRGSDDFGHVVPNAQVVQTLSIERQAD